MKKVAWMFVGVVAVSSFALADDPTIAEVTHRQLQAVNQFGSGTYSATDKVIVEGIIINSPEEMLDPEPGEIGMGGQWQMYIQGEGDDHAGTAVWFGQNYSTVTSQDDYTEQEYLDELYRINADSDTGYVFNVGDRVRVTGWYKFYKGKLNINEKHEVSPFYDFEIELVTPAAGVPTPETITLNDLKDETDSYIFDPNRIEGCEYYQGCLVRINNVTITNPENWGQDSTLNITDGQGRSFPVLLGRGSGFTRYACPGNPVDVIGILDQEASGYFPCMDGYRIWVVNYDGNGLVLTDRGYQRGNLPGDVNRDFVVNLVDFAEMAADWMMCVPGLCE